MEASEMDASEMELSETWYRRIRQHQRNLFIVPVVFIAVWLPLHVTFFEYGAIDWIVAVATLMCDIFFFVHLVAFEAISGWGVARDLEPPLPSPLPSPPSSSSSAPASPDHSTDTDADVTDTATTLLNLYEYDDEENRWSLARWSGTATNVAAMVPQTPLLLLATFVLPELEVPLLLQPVTSGLSPPPLLLVLARLSFLFRMDLDEKIKRLTKLHPTSARLVHLILWACIVLHWVTCAYHLVCLYEGCDSSGWVLSCSIMAQPARPVYLHSLFWAFSSLTGDIRQPETEVEIVFSIFIMLIGAFTFCTLIGSFSSILSAADSAALAFHEKMLLLQRFMQGVSLPKPLQRRILQYYDYLWDRHKGMDVHSILEDLPSNLRNEVAMALTGDVVRKVPIFKDCEPSFTARLVELLQPRLYAPRDTIIFEGELGKEMYFIVRGAVEIVIGGTVVNTLGAMQYFGELALLFNTPRTATIRAVSFCDLFVLERDDLEALMKDFPARAAKIYQASLNRYKHDSSMHTAAIRQYLSQWESNSELQKRPKRRQSESGVTSKPDFNRSVSTPQAVVRPNREARAAVAAAAVAKHTFEGAPSATATSSTSTTSTSSTNPNPNPNSGRSSPFRPTEQPLSHGKAKGAPVDDALSRLASTEVQRPMRQQPRQASGLLRVPRSPSPSPPPSPPPPAEVVVPCSDGDPAAMFSSTMDT